MDPKNQVLMGVHTGARRKIKQNDPSSAVKWHSLLFKIFSFVLTYNSVQNKIFNDDDGNHDTVSPE